MCHGYEWEIVRRAYEEQVRRTRAKEAEQAKQGSAVPQPPAEPPPRVRDRETVPA